MSSYHILNKKIGGKIFLLKNVSEEEIEKTSCTLHGALIFNAP
jgi:hypothetical protein